MNAITQIITQQLGGNASRTIAQRFGISETTANTAIQMAVPLILTAMARNASQPQEAQNLHQAVATDHDGASSIMSWVTCKIRKAQMAQGFWDTYLEVKSRRLKAIWRRQREWIRILPGVCWKLWLRS